jgi:hypothetical protein
MSTEKAFTHLEIIRGKAAAGNVSRWVFRQLNFLRSTPAQRPPPDGPIVLHDVHFLEQMADFNRVKAPERQPHA